MFQLSGFYCFEQGPKRPPKHKDPTNHGSLNAPCLRPWDHHVGILVFVFVFDCMPGEAQGPKRACP